MLSKMTRPEQIPRRSCSLKSASSGWEAIFPYLSEELYPNKVLVGPARGAHALVTLIAELYNMGGLNDYRHIVQMGTIKNTNDYGNTSVAMGLAADKYFSMPNCESQVGFLNCGQGGIKYQLYSRNEDGIISAKEYKPGGGFKPGGQSAASFAKLNCGEYKVDRDQVMSKEDLLAKLADEIQWAPWNTDRRGKIPLYAFVTGELRNCFYSQSEKERKEINELVNSVFKHNTPEQIAQPVSVLLGSPELSYFISTKEESFKETIGTCLMYKQVNSVTPNQKPLKVIMTVAMGRSTSGVCQINAKGEMKHLISSVGMDDPSCLNLGQALVEHYATNPADLEELVGSIRDCHNRGSIPIIAPKSGCLLVLDQPGHPAYKALLGVLDPITVTIGLPDSKKEYELRVDFGTTHADLCILSSQVLREHTKKNVQIVEVRDAENPKDKVVCVTSGLQGKKLYVYPHQSFTHFGTEDAKKNKILSFEKLSKQLPEDWKPSTHDEEISQTTPLDSIYDKWQLMNNRKGKTKQEEERIWSTDSTLVALKGFASSLEIQLSSSLLIGYMKATSKSGNSSVSMGLARKFFNDEDINKEGSSIVIFLNCGTGGIKIQVYTKSPQSDGKERIALLGEQKIGKKWYEARGVLELIQKTDLWQNLGKEGKIPIFAFVTGQERNAWENGDTNMKECERNRVKGFFEAKDGGQVIRPVSELLCPGNPPNYLISNDDEGSLELSAQYCMYKQVDPGLCVVASISVEGATSRVTIVESEEKNFDHLANHKVVHTFAGMSNYGGKELDIEKLVDVLKAHSAEFTKVVAKCIRLGDKPVIAIKAGGTLLLEAEPDLRVQFGTKSTLFCPDIQCARTVTLFIQNINVPWGVIECAIPVPITAARLCDLAAKLLETRDKFFRRIFHKTAKGEMILFEETKTMADVTRTLAEEIKEEIKEEKKTKQLGVLTLQDFDKTKDVNGKMRLYFSCSRSETPSFEIKSDIVELRELRYRAKEICVDELRRSFVANASDHHFGDPEVMFVADNIAETNRIMSPYQQWFEEHIEPYTPPPYGKEWGKSVQLRAAIFSLEKKLPIGQYISGDMKTCLRDVLEEHVSESALENADLPWSESGFEICRALTTRFKHVCLHIIYPNMRTPTIFPTQTTYVQTRHIWIYSEDETFTSCASLWSPRETDRQEDWQCFRSSLHQKENVFKYVARLWSKIAESKSPHTKNRPLLRRLVKLHVLAVLGQSRGATQRSSFTSKQWASLRTLLVRIVTYGVTNADYVSEVCFAFHVSVYSLARWNDLVIQQNELDEWTEFYRILYNYLQRQQYEELNPEEAPFAEPGSITGVLRVAWDRWRQICIRAGFEGDFLRELRDALRHGDVMS